jgi:hypothetical protein
MGAVTGISHIEYILPIASYAFTEKKDTISIEEILSIVRNEAIKREKEKALAIGKFWQDYEKKMAKKRSFLQGITTSLILAMKKWGLIKEIEPRRTFQVLSALFDIGNFNLIGDLERAKLYLYELILKSKKEKPFEPLNFLMKIRDNKLEEIEAVIKRGDEEIVEIFKVPYLEGRVYNDNRFVCKVLETNFRSFDIMKDWGRFFELIDTYEEVPISIDAKNGKIEYPKYEVFLTKVVCTIDEAHKFLEFAKEKNVASITDFIDNFKKSKYATISILHNLKALNLIEYKEGRIIASNSGLSIQKIEELVKAVFEGIMLRKGFLVVDSPEDKAVLLEPSSRINVDPRYSLIMFNPSWSLTDFERTIKEFYDRLTGGMHYRYVWIPLLRKEVCRELRIHSSMFDSLLSKLKDEKPESIEFAKAAGNITRIMLKKFDKPFKYKGEIFRMMRIGG